MTIIAYKNGVIAADTVATASGLKMGHVKKITKNKDGDVIGAAGSSGWCHAMRQWFEEGEEGPVPQILQSASDEDTGQAIIIRAAAPEIVHTVYSNPRHYPDKVTIRERCGIAIGSGRGEAMGAMYAGADPIKAVEAAIFLDDGCGGSVDWERLGNG